MQEPSSAWPARAVWPQRDVSVADSDPGPKAGAELAELDDRALVGRCLAGQREAFDELVIRHSQAVYRLCYRFVGNHEDASDLAQDVFLRAYRGLGNFKGDASLGTWLYRIGVNACLNHVTSKALPTQSIEDSNPIAGAALDPAAGLIRQEQAARVRAAVSRLPRKQRATLVLRIYHERSHKEIAEILGSSVGAVKANFFHALNNLKRFLEDELLRSAGERR
jgi:RNA polymerase sigma-70 factor (ECF subfamily)